MKKNLCYEGIIFEKCMEINSKKNDQNLEKIALRLKKFKKKWIKTYL